MFLQKGYRETKVSDITKSLNIGKGTFYFYFSDKKELLLECVPIIFERLFANGWETIRQLKDPVKRLEFRAKMILPYFKEFCAIIQLSKEALEDPDAKIKQLGGQTYNSIRKPLESDLKKGMEIGVFREMNPIVASTLMIGLMENLYYMQIMDKELSVDKIWDSVLDILNSGIGVSKSSKK